VGRVAHLGERDADVGRVIGRHHARTAAVSDDHQAVAARAEVREQRLCGGVHLADLAKANHAGAAQGGVEHVVGAHQRAGMREGGLLARRVLADLDQQHRLATRGGAQCAHEAARVLDAFDVEEDALGARVGHHVVEYFAEIHIAFRAEGHDI